MDTISKGRVRRGFLRAALATATVVAVTSTLVAGCGISGGGAVPQDAYGVAGQLPPGAQAFSGTQADWNNLKAEGRLVVLSQHQMQLDAALAAQQRAAADATISAFTARHPELSARIAQLLAPPSPSDAGARAENLKLEGEVYTRVVPLKNGASKTIATLAESHKRMIVAGALAAFDPNNQVRTTAKLYEHLYTRMSADPRFSDIKGTFKTPDRVYALGNYADVQKEVMAFNRVLQLPVGIFTPRPPSPEQEIGYGTGGDRTSASCTATSPTGVIGSGYDFPLKYAITSVKDQGGRGSCVAFGVSAALESALARDRGQYVNVSEQDLYYHMKGFWWPTGDGYGDGSDVHAIFDKMASLDGGYFVPFENQWDYNPSLSRMANDATRTYSRSCQGYGEYCSDTNHQGGLFCIGFLGFNYCGYITQAPTTTQAVRASSDAEIWDHADVNKSFVYTLIALWLGSPVVVSLPVTPSFDGAGATGYVSYAGPGETNRGGHALEVVGFVDDGKLPAGAPKAGERGGGGYFIIKNSWGTCWGDTGFVYVPYQWMRDYAYSMIVLNGVAER